MARILIVDDSPTEMYKLTGLLEKHGHEVLKAENGGDGVALTKPVDEERLIQVLNRVLAG